MSLRKLAGPAKANDQAPVSAPAAPRPAAAVQASGPAPAALPRSRLSGLSAPRKAPTAKAEQTKYLNTNHESVRNFGRSGSVPPSGSGYDAFLDWAAGGGIPTEEDADLALRLWAGLERHPDQEASQPSMG